MVRWGSTPNLNIRVGIKVRFNNMIRFRDRTIFKVSVRLVFRVSERERNVLFNDTLNTFYLRLYGVRHMVKDHSDSEKGNPLPPHRLLLSINSKGSFICLELA